MPRFNFTFQGVPLSTILAQIVQLIRTPWTAEASPLVTYTGFWTEGSKNNDSFFQKYDGSFRVTNATGAQATLTFTGTGVSLFGAMRPNHGDYAVVVDNSTKVQASGNSQIDQFRLPLRQVYGLPYQQHAVQVTNEPTSPQTPYFDLDFVQIERTAGQDNDTLFEFHVDNSSPLVTYSGFWEPFSAVSSLNNGTIHQTLQSDSSFSITFQGCCIELYGLYANAAFIVAIDGGLPQSMQGQDLDIPPDIWHPQTLLYVADGLSENTNHTVLLTTTYATLQRPFFFDYGVVRSTQNFSASLPPLPTSVNSASKQTPVAVIVGASVGGVVLISLIIGAWILWRRRRRISSQPDTTIQPENRNGRTLPDHTITAWYPPSGTLPQAQNSLDTRREYLSSGTTNSGPPPNTSSNSRPSKRRADFGGQFASPTDSSTTPTSPQSGSGVSAPSMHMSTSSPPSLPQMSERESVVAPQDQLASSSSLTPVREQDAGLLYRDGQGEILPPAYNPGWNSHSS